MNARFVISDPENPNGCFFDNIKIFRRKVYNQSYQDTTIMYLHLLKNSNLLDQKSVRSLNKCQQFTGNP